MFKESDWGAIVFDKSENKLLSILQEESGSGFSIYCEDCHAHVSPEKLEIAVQDSLIGKVQYCELYRHEAYGFETLAATFLRAIEFGGRFAPALYFHPFDREEWELWAGEKYQLVVHTIDPASETGITKSLEPDPEFGSLLEAWNLTFFEENLGTPPRGSRWTASSFHKFIFPLRDTWRRYHATKVDDSELYCNHLGMCRMQILLFYRPDEENIPAPGRDFRLPISIKRDEIEVMEGFDWNSIKWELEFANGNSGMLAQVIVQAPFGDAEFQEMIDFFDKNLELSRFLQRIPMPDQG